MQMVVLEVHPSWLLSFQFAGWEGSGLVGFVQSGRGQAVVTFNMLNLNGLFHCLIKKKKTAGARSLPLLEVDRWARLPPFLTALITASSIYLHLQETPTH